MGRKFVEGTFIPASLFTRFDIPEEESKKILEDAKTLDPNNEEACNLLGALIHEWTHKVQTLTTSFGRELRSLLMSSGLGFGKAYSEYVKEGNFHRLRRPLQFNMFYDKKFSKIVTSKSYIALITAAFANHYIGGTSNAIRYKPLTNHAQKLVTPPKETVCPQIEFEGDILNFGGIHLCEAFALDNEAAFILNYYSPENCWNHISSIEKYPYFVVSSYLNKELGNNVTNDLISRMLCELALNGCFMNPNNEELLVWEDVHPGWRFVRAVEYLQENKHLIKDLSPEGALEVKNKICSYFGWQDPWQNPPRFTSSSKTFMPEAMELRKDHPLALIFCAEFLEELVDRIPFNFGYAKPPPGLAILQTMLGESEGLSTEEQYGLFSETSIIAECVEYILWNTELICPIHLVSLKDENHYKAECPVVESFNSLFGFSIEDFYKIPLATKEDIELFQNENI